MIDHIVSSQVINDPWPHSIINQVMDEELWQCVEEATIALAPHILHGADSIDVRCSYEQGVLPSTINKIVDFADTLIDRHVEILSKFQHVKLSKYGYMMDLRWGFLKNQTDPFFDIHTDTYNPSKKMTFIVYTSPLKDCGTLTFSDMTTFDSEVPWEINSGLMFCPSETSWHSYKNYHAETPRITLNFYFHEIDSWFDKQYREKTIERLGEARVEWFLSYFKQGKLIRTDYDFLGLFK